MTALVLTLTCVTPLYTVSSAMEYWAVAAELAVIKTRRYRVVTAVKVTPWVPPEPATFDAVVSDYSMDSDADGLDLLHLVKVQYPDTVRFLVTANRDLEVAVRAVNEGAVHRYFLKPWNDDKLRSALEIVLHARKTPGDVA